MRRIAAYGFIALSSCALLMKTAAEPRAPLALKAVFALGPSLPGVEAHGVPLIDTKLSMLPAPPAETQVTIVLAGDTGLNGSFQPVQAGFGLKQGARLAFQDATPGIAAEINGEINFANLETVVTDRNDLPASPKMFGFRTHPDGVRQLMGLGFNIFSTANNHAMDYGTEGARETLKQLKALGVAQAGMGLGVVSAKGFRFAFGAVDQAHEAGGTVAALGATPADFRVLSVHYGTEFEVATIPADRARFGRALAEGVDMVVGHHQHVVAGVEIVDGKPVFYGLGNFLHWGTQDMSRHDMCHDYGLVARVHLAGISGGALSVRAIEAIPVTGMNKATRRLEAGASGERVQALNWLDERLGAHGVRFAVEADGTGLYCAPGAERLAGPVGARCAAGVAARAPEAALATRIAEACTRTVVRLVEGDEAVLAGQ